MRTARRSSSSYDGLASALRSFVARRAQELIGLSLLAIAGLVAASLATWSVDDPSLNNATDSPVHNILGWPGAIVADLAMQIVGLGSIAALLPLAVWGWRLMKSGELGRRQLRLALWIIGAAAATAVASAMPATDRWPLPSGLGGVVGDAILAAARAITGMASGPAVAALGIVFAVVAILSLSAACGLGLSDEPHRDVAEDFDDNVARGRKAKQLADWDESDDVTPDEPGWGIVSLGALAHGFMSLRGAARRFAESRRGGDDDEFPEMASPRTGTMRREPRLDSGAPHPRTAPASAPKARPFRDVPYGRQLSRETLVTHQ